MSEQTEARTRASTIGHLPDTIGVVLLGVVVGTILVFGSQFGYPVQSLAVIVVSGIAAALGVRVAAVGRSRNLIIGVTVLWVSALVFTGGTVLLVVQRPPSGLITALLPFVVAATALLGPFGVVSNTIRTYGQGAGSAVLRRYLIGTLVLVLLVSGLGAVSVFSVLGAETLFAPLPAAGVVVGILNSLSVRVMAAIVVYSAAFLLLPRVVQSFPAEVFVRVTELNRLTSFRRVVATLSRYGLGLVLIYALTSALALFALNAPDTAPGSTVEAVQSLSTITVPLMRAGAAPTVVATVGFGAGLVIVGSATFGRLRDLGTVSGAAIAEAVVPPAILFTVVLGFATVFADRVPVALLKTQVAVVAAPGSLVYEIVTSRLQLVLLGLGTLAILVSGLVLSIPVFIAGATPGDNSLTGLIASVVALTVLVIIAVVTEESLDLLLLGVGSAAVVWEVGEFATVAAGELWSESRASGLPAGYMTLFSIHAVVTLCVTAVGAAVVVGLATVVVSATLPLTVALPAVLATVVGLAALMLLLTG